MLTFLRRTVLPLGVWLGVMGTAGWLWVGLRTGSVRGFVEGIAYGVAAPAPGRLTAVLVVPGQHVRAGDPIAQIDDRELQAEVAAVVAEQRRVEAELGAVTAQTQMEIGDSSRGIEESVDSADLAREEARAERSIAAAELAALDVQVATTRELVDKRMADRRDLAELDVRKAALERQLKVADGIIRRLDAQATSARSRRAGLPSDTTVKVTGPLRAELEVLGAQLEQLAARRDSLTLRAPADGEVTAVLLRPGEVVDIGALVATIAGPAMATEQGAPVVFVCGGEGATAEIGTIARLAPPEGGGEVLTAHVQRVSPEVAQLPMRCWRDPRIPQWGRGIFLALDQPIALVPGQTFAVQLTDEPSPHATAAKRTPPSEPPPVASKLAEPDAPAPGEPKPILLPASLIMRSRFEPSGIAWSAARERYLVISDDTGFDGREEHSPWLFMMDKSGKVDPEPLVIDGVKKINDAEAIAVAPDGVYVLASQSHNTKGKRARPRQFFGRVAIDPSGARVTASTELATALDAAGSERLAELGLVDTNTLDIEGITATRDGGLLVGLKSPLDDNGDAIVWHMAAPDRLLATGRLADGEVRPLLRVRLPITADGAQVGGGVSDLVELPDGDLLVTATAATGDPTSQDGALFRVTRATGAVTLVRTFPGRKPEGVALGATGDTIAVVFDAGAGMSSWLELPWPAR